MKRLLIWGIGFVVLGGLLLPLGTPLYGPILLGFALALGWVRFLRRVMPAIHVDGAGVATALVCVVLFLVGSHAFLRWLSRSLQGEGAAVRPWSPRWTLALGALVVLLFAAGTSAVGITHQVGWLFTSGERWMEPGSTAMFRAFSHNNLKHLGIGTSSLVERHDGRLPGVRFDAIGTPLHGWQTELLPFIEENRLFDSIDLSTRWDDPANGVAFRTVMRNYLNPGFRDHGAHDGRGYALSHYAGNVRVLGGDRPLTLDVGKKGSSQTILAGEVASGFRPWGDPLNLRDPALGINRVPPQGFGGPYPGGANVVLLDGSVRFVKDSISPEVLRALSTPDGPKPGPEVEW